MNVFECYGDVNRRPGELHIIKRNTRRNLCRLCVLSLSMRAGRRDMIIPDARSLHLLRPRTQT